MSSGIVKAAALLVPALVLGGISGLHAYNQRNGLLWQVPITGYDPRDLLSGHYLQFRYEWNVLFDALEPLQCQEVQCALCADDPTAFNPLVTLQPLDLAQQQCPSFIAGTMDAAGNFQIGDEGGSLTRYYIPEEEAGRLDALLRNQEVEAVQFVMGLRVNSEGSAFIDTLFLDGMPLPEWLQTH